MDPNAALEELRALLKDPHADPKEVVEKFNELDRWLANGGFLPLDWFMKPPTTKENST